MSVTSKAAGAVSKQFAPRIGELAPGLTTSFVREALHRAIVGVGPLPPASKAADAQLREQKGNVEKAVHEVIENHVTYAAAQGFVTNVGGLVTLAITIPTNITGLALIQCRMIAGIAHLRGYDLDDPRVRNAILTTMIGETRSGRAADSVVPRAGGPRAQMPCGTTKPISARRSRRALSVRSSRPWISLADPAGPHRGRRGVDGPAGRREEPVAETPRP